jgi:N-acetylmuramoyl-L-alanine amidase
VTPAQLLLERFLLALCVWREARGETSKGKRLVAWTIANRRDDPKHRWPGTIEGVVLQPWQFSSFNKNDPNATQFPAPGPVWDDCVAAADEVHDGGVRLTDANHYHVVGLDPAWRDETKVVATEGHHVFYRL